MRSIRWRSARSGSASAFCCCCRWPCCRAIDGRDALDWPGLAGLGVLYFALFPILFNASLIFTTAARGALALSTLPLLTMVVGAALGSEALTMRKSVGVVIATLGVALALLSNLALRAIRGLARRSADGRRRAVHGVLQHLVQALHRPFRPNPLHDHVHGSRRRMSDSDLVRARQFCAGRGFRGPAVAGGHLSRRLRRRADVLSCGRSRWRERRRPALRSRSPSIRSPRRWSVRHC